MIYKILFSLCNENFQKFLGQQCAMCHGLARSENGAESSTNKIYDYWFVKWRPNNGGGAFRCSLYVGPQK